MYARFAFVARLSGSFWPRKLFARRRNHCGFHRANTLPPSDSVTVIQSDVWEATSTTLLKRYPAYLCRWGRLPGGRRRNGQCLCRRCVSGTHPVAPTACADKLIAEENGFHPRDQAWFELEEAIKPPSPPPRPTERGGGCEKPVCDRHHESTKKPTVHPSRASGRTVEHLKSTVLLTPRQARD
jgi:hypothetical protein